MRVFGFVLVLSFVLYYFSFALIDKSLHGAMPKRLKAPALPKRRGESISLRQLAAVYSLLSPLKLDALMINQKRVGARRSESWYENRGGNGCGCE